MQTTSNVKMKFRWHCMIVCAHLTFSPLTARAEVTDIPAVRYSPRAERVARVENPTIDLSGDYYFQPNPSAEFDKLDPAKWSEGRKLQVPSQLDHVYKAYDREKLKSTAFLRTFHVPTDWRNASIKLRPDSIEGRATVWINGKFAGEHAGGFIPFELDVTGLVKAGQQNTIVIHVERASISRASEREYLGLARSIRLLALPKVNLAELNVNPTLDATYVDGVLELEATVENESDDIANDINIAFSLLAPDGQAIEIPPIELPPVASRVTARKAMRWKLSEVLTWDPEHPRLYTLIAELKQGQETLSRNRLQIGFRRIDVQGRELLLNGRPIKLRGMNYHPNYPGVGHAIDEEQLRRDMKLFQNANVNFVRSFPPQPELAHICDELGIMQQIETPVTFVDVKWRPDLHDVIDDPEFATDFVKLSLEKIAFYRNHPSVIIWSVGNESNFKLPPFVAAGKATQAADSTRPVLVDSYSAPLGIDIPYAEIDNVHYPDLHGTALPKRRPMLYGEWAHLHHYHHEVATHDPGVRDYWGHYMLQHINYLYSQPGVLGGSVFSGNDEEFPTEPALRWGIFDAWRRPKPEYWHVKKAHSPIRISTTTPPFLAPGHELSLTVRNRCAFTNLSELKIEWRTGDASGWVHADIPPGESGLLQIPVVLDEGTDGSDVLVDLTFTSPQGFVIDTYQLTLATTESPIEPKSGRTADITIEQDDEKLCILSGEASWEIDKRTGLIRRGLLVDQTVVTGGPMLHATPLLEAEPAICRNWKLESLRYEATDSSAEVVVTGSYEEARGSYKMQFDALGEVTIDYEFEWLKPAEPGPVDWWNPPGSGDMREVGIMLCVNPSLDHFAWQRNGMWTTYPNDHIGRLRGNTRAFSIHAEMPRSNDLQPTQPWSLDQTSNGTADFRGTKYNFLRASLTDERNKGLHLVSDASNHVRCSYEEQNDAIRCFINCFSNGGIEHFVHGKGIPLRETMHLDTESIVHGRATLRLK